MCIMGCALPLVSIMIPNYNHSRYLDECILSAKRQTYRNVEIIVLDNASEDSSMRTAVKYEGGKVRVCRNPYNILSTSYQLLDQLANGKYRMLLGADDFIEPDFVARAVALMEQHPNVGYVHGERDFITDTGEVIELEPFYRCSFTAPGRDVMPIYMVTTMAQASQGIFRSDAFHECGGYDIEIDHMNVDRMLWFYLSYISDYGYIREKMCKIRVGRQTETFSGQSDFHHPVFYHLTVKEMVRFAKAKGLEAVYNREAEALERLAKDFLNCAAGMLVVGDSVCAGRYLEYAQFLSELVTQQETFKCLMRMQQGKAAIDMDYLSGITLRSLQKPRNYEPPPHYKLLNWEIPQ